MRLGLDAWMLGTEVSAVMMLRGLKLASGQDADGRETARMVTEKVDAALALQAMAITGSLGLSAPIALDRTLKHYRRKVRANRRRLTRREGA